jgi:excisionase family DNA binding protein
MRNYLTTQAAAQFLGVTAARIRQLILDERIKSVKMGRDHFIPQSELVNSMSLTLARWLIRIIKTSSSIFKVPWIFSSRSHRLNCFCDNFM